MYAIAKKVTIPATISVLMVVCLATASNPTARKNLFGFFAFGVDSAASAATSNLLQDINSLEFVELDHRSYDQNSIAQLSMGGKLFYLSGDMNVESTHSAFGVLSSFMSNTRDVAPKDHTDKNTTYNAYSDSKYSVIDHIYCTKTLKVVEYHTVNENYGVPYVSDHYPIYAIIKLL